MTSFTAVDSQQQTITWDHTDPNAWTFERVMFWLQVHNFGPEWKRVFKENDIRHDRFLALSNYRNLKSLGLTDSVSRFIRLARAFEKPQGYKWFDQDKSEPAPPERSDKEKLHKRSESATTTSSYWSNSDTRCSPSVMSFSHRSFEKYMFLGDNLRPRRQPHGGKHVALTTDNINFALVSISDCADVDEIIENFKTACNVGPGCLITVHLTEYFCTPGEALSNKQLWNVLSAAAGDIVKFYIHAEIKSPLLSSNDNVSPRSNLNISAASDGSGHSLLRPSPKRRASPASFANLTFGEDNQHSPLSMSAFEDESSKSTYSENTGSPGTGKNIYPDTPSYLISTAENAEVDYFNIRPSRLSLITETDNSLEKPNTRSDAIVSPYRNLGSQFRDTRRTISSPIAETPHEGSVSSSDLQRRAVSGPTALSSVPSTKSTTSTTSTASGYQPSKSMQKSTAALLARERENNEDTRRNLPRLKVNTNQDFQNPAFKILRETGNKEINFDKPRISPYEDHSTSNGLVPRRNAPPPPLARQASSKYRPELSPNGQSIEERRPMVRTTSDRKIPPRLPSLQRIPMPVPEAESTQISWDDVPEVSDEDSDDGGDGLWAIQPNQSNHGFHHQEDTFDESTHSSANNTKLSERVARPSTEDVYDNLEQFFPDADLDKPVIITNKAEPPQDTAVAIKPIQQQTGITRMKSIRVVASEASHRIKSNRVGPARSRPILRRKSTKMWGQKVVEMARGNPITLRDQKQYMWIKGELIGKGTFGKVFMGFNVTTGDVMAVKQVRTVTRRATQEQKASEGVDNLFREVENMKDLDHPNIVQYLGFEVKGETSNLFLEYVPGGSVKSIMAQYGRFQEEIIQHLSRQVLEGLTYLHSRGILHRDLKADNLLLDIDGTAKISDFGISKRSRDIYSNNAEMSMQGTIFWMAPEVIRNVVENERQGYSAKVDIWSFGCVVLEMFAGRRPWSTEEAIGAMYKLGSSKMAPPIPEDARPFMSSNGVQFLEKCFIIDPSERPTADVLLDDEFTLVDAGFRFQDTTLGQKLTAQASVTMSFPRQTTE